MERSLVNKNIQLIVLGWWFCCCILVVLCSSRQSRGGGGGVGENVFSLFCCVALGAHSS